MTIVFSTLWLVGCVAVTCMSAESDAAWTAALWGFNSGVSAALLMQAIAKHGAQS